MPFSPRAEPIALDALADAAFDAVTIGLALIDAQGRTRRVNPALAALVGREEAEIRARGVQEILGAGVASRTALVLTRRDGSSVRLRVALAPIAGPGDVDGAQGVLVQLTDVGEQERLLIRERALRTAADLAGDVAFAADADGRWTFLSDAWSRLTDLDTAGGLRTAWRDHVHPDDRPACDAALRALVDGESAALDLTCRHVLGGGRERRLRVQARAGADGVFGTLRDVPPGGGDGARHVADLRSLSTVTRVLAGADDPRQAACDAAVETLGASSAVVLEADALRRMVATAVSGGGPIAGELLDAGRAAGVAAALASGRPCFVSGRAAAGAPRGAATLRSVLHQPVLRGDRADAVLTVTWNAPLGELGERAAAIAELLADALAARLQREALLEALDDAATIDPLTGALNRRGWEGALYLELQRARRSGDPLSVALIDLDRFRELGGGAADAVLCACVERWRGALRVTDVLARLGDDDFAVLLPECALADGDAVRARLEACTAHRPGGSIGLVEWDGSESAQELMARSASMLYEQALSRRADRLHDPARLAAVRELEALGEQPLLSELAGAAATAVGAPIAAVALVDGDRRTLAGRHGLDDHGGLVVPLSTSLCHYPTATGRALVVADAREHPLVGDSDAVRGGEVVAYAGVPLRTSDGTVVGALCAISLQPRPWDDGDVQVLERFAVLAATELERLREAHGARRAA